MKGIWYRPAKIIKEEDWVNCVPENIVLGNEIYNEYTKQTVVGTMPCGVSPSSMVSVVGKSGSTKLFRGRYNQVSDDLSFGVDGYFMPNYANKTSNQNYASCEVDGAEKIGNINAYPIYKVWAGQQITQNKYERPSTYGGMFYKPTIGKVGLSARGIKKGVTIGKVTGTTEAAYPVGGLACYTSGSNYPNVRFHNINSNMPSFSTGSKIVQLEMSLGEALYQTFTVFCVIHSDLSTIPEPVLTRGTLYTDHSFSGGYGEYHFTLSDNQWTYLKWKISAASNIYLEVYMDKPV